jgi:hypothetical protein
VGHSLYSKRGRARPSALIGLRFLAVWSVSSARAEPARNLPMFVCSHQRYDRTRSSMDISSASRTGIWSDPAGSLPLRAISRSNLSTWYA